MLPQVYQTICRKHLNEQQYLTLELALLLIQAHRQVTLATLASLFPQPIKYASRKRNWAVRSFCCNMPFGLSGRRLLYQRIKVLDFSGE